MSRAPAGPANCSAAAASGADALLQVELPLGRLGCGECAPQHSLGDQLDRDVEKGHAQQGHRDRARYRSRGIGDLAAHLQRGFHPEEREHQQQPRFAHCLERRQRGDREVGRVNVGQPECDERDKRKQLGQGGDSVEARTKRGPAHIDDGKGGEQRDQYYRSRRRPGEKGKEAGKSIGEHCSDRGHGERDAEPEQDAADVSDIWPERGFDICIWAPALRHPAPSLGEAERHQRCRDGAHEIGQRCGRSE